MRQETVLGRDDPVLVEHYSDILRLFPDAVIIRDEGVA